MTDQGARNDALTELLRDVSADETDLPVLSVAPLSDSGRVWIDGERILYASKVQGDPSWLMGCTRGADQNEGGTEARPHNGGDYVWQDNRRSTGNVALEGSDPASGGVTDSPAVQLTGKGNNAGVVRRQLWQIFVDEINDFGAGELKIQQSYDGGTATTPLAISPGGDASFIGAIAIADGMTAPATVVGKAFLYVDVADGDLKIKFGDGTVKTIVVDT